MIKPTIGRIVWYHPVSESDNGLVIDDEQPCTASVVFVESDTSVHLSVTDHYGEVHYRPSAQLLQDDDEKPDGESYAEWMPYQIGQAKKHADEEQSSGKTA